MTRGYKAGALFMVYRYETREARKVTSRLCAAFYQLQTSTLTTPSKGSLRLVVHTLTRNYWIIVPPEVISDARNADVGAECGRPSSCRASQASTVNWVKLQTTMARYLHQFFWRFWRPVALTSAGRCHWKLAYQLLTPAPTVVFCAFFVLWVSSPYATDGRTDRLTNTTRNAAYQMTA